MIVKPASSSRGKTWKNAGAPDPWEEISQAMTAGKQLVGQTEIRDEKSGRAAVIEFPIKTIHGGTLTILLKQRQPQAEIFGLDGDPQVLEIAREKAGVMKRGKPVVISSQDRFLLKQLLSMAETSGSPAYAYGRDFHAEILHGGVSYHAGEFSLNDLELALKGRFQADNAATAITAARLLGPIGFQTRLD